MNTMKAPRQTNGLHAKTQDCCEDIVISGIAGRFPDSDNIKHFQENLFNKVDLISDDNRRWNLDNSEIPQRTGKINNISKFDAKFFGINYKQAHTFDPMIRLLMEHSYESIIDAGINPCRLRGGNTGVFIGSSLSESEQCWHYEKMKVGGYGFLGCDRSMLANCVSQWLGVNGPSFAIDTACSSSFFVMDQAFRSIRNGLCDSAIVGSASLCLHPLVSQQFFRLGVLSSDGKSKCFDESANGYVRSEAIGVIFLQKAKDAKRIYATYVHGKTNCDGYKEHGITYPSSDIQTILLKECYDECGVDPKDVAFVETHGTGTKVGDPVESRTIDDIFCKGRSTPLMIGSIKSNMGHTEPASGICSLVKTVIAMETGYIPPNLHFNQPRKEIKPLIEGRMKVVTDVTPWEGGYVAVNSFGFGGANGHILLKSNSKEKINNGLPQDDLPRLVVVSGCTTLAVDSLLSDVASRPVDAEHVSLLNDIHSEDIKGHFYRGYTIIGGLNPRNNIAKEIRKYSGNKKQICFVLSGLGSQWSGMGSALLRFSAFANAIRKCDTVLKPHNVNIYDILSKKDDSAIENIMQTLVGVVAVQIGLVDLLNQVGISPDYIIGYSVGELACAYADGCLTADQTILSAYVCGKISMEFEEIKGLMAIVGLDHATLVKLCPSDIEVCCHDATDITSICGPIQSMINFMKKLEGNKIFVKKIPTCGITYHRSAAPVRAKLIENLQKVIPHPKPRSFRWLSTSYTHNEWTMPGARVASAEYITNNLLKPVLFLETFSEIPKNTAIVEISANAVLQNTLQKLAEKNAINISLMHSNHKDNTEIFLQGLGELYTIGCQPQLQNLYPRINYPVSRGTPMISPVLKWDHSEDWYVYKYVNNENIGRTERIVNINLSEDEYKYMSGHVVDGRNLLPTSGYLYLIWETFGKLRQRVFSRFPVVFENVKFQRATSIPKDGSIQLLISLQEGSGDFEISEAGTTVVSGTIREAVDASTEKIDPPIMTVKDEEMSSRDIYKELRLRGYHYSGLFRAIKGASINANQARITWADNWVAFMDNMLQLQILGTDSRGLFVPTGITKLVIDPISHIQQVCTTDCEEKFFYAYTNKKFKTIVAGGIEIQGLKTSAISKRKPTSDPVLEKYQFVAYRDKAKVSIKEAVHLVVHIASENNLGITVKTVEIVDDDKSIIPVSPLILEVLTNIPLTQADITLCIDSKNLTNQEIPKDVNIVDPPKLTGEANSLIAIGHYLFSKKKDNIISLLLSCIKDGGFLLTYESLNCNFSDSKWLNDLHIVLEKRTENGLLLCLRKIRQVKKSIIVIHVNNKEFSWVENMKNILKGKEKTSNENIRYMFVGEGDFECGLLGLVNCLSKELGGEIVRGVLIQDMKAPKFSLDNPIYSKQLDIDLVINVFRGGVWGSYRHLSLPPLKLQPVHHACVNSTARGDLSSLQWLESWIQPDFKHPDLVNIVYASINFKDVMLATGKLALEVAIQSRLQDNVIGLEYSGIDQSGKHVMGLSVNACLSNLQIALNNLCWEVPAEWTLEDAATVPCVYGTCIYALYLFGKLKKGEKILIHAGAGGIGQAAINLALYEGCEIFTTVGTPEKRKFIREMFPQIPEDHIGNSRDTSFEQMIMKHTNGEGVDLVLNSLAEEKLVASVRCLARGGRFLEIGKFDLAANNMIGLKSFSREISYHSIILGSMFNCTEDKQIVVKNLLASYLKKGAIKPLVRTVFPMDKVEAAFRIMAAGKHIGKVLINVRGKDEPLNKPILAVPHFYCNAKCSYLILGGLGGFGLELADWLVLRRAKNIVLTSRKGIKNGYQKMRVKLWQSYGVNVVIISEKDASKEQDCADILKTTAELGPVDAIFNLAVVLKDNLWENQTQESFQESFRSKAWSTNQLDKLSRKMCPNLRHFVVFSSVSCGRGNAGQTNYGMANSVMERICEKRAAEGLPALAVQWGAIGDVGLVAEMQENNRELIIGGTLQQSISSCLKELEVFMYQKNPVVASMVVAEKHAGGGKGTTIAETVSNILGLKDLKSISQQTPLAELGMDSMMVVEIKQTLEREFDVFLTAQNIRSLNLSKLFQIQKQLNSGEQKPDARENNDSNISGGMGLLIRTIGSENMNTEEIITMPSKGEKGLGEVLLIPGLEGYGSVFMSLAKKIRAPATCLQLSLKNENRNIENIVIEALPHVLCRSKDSKDLVIVGYSFGSLVAIELTRILERKNFNIRLVCIDGSPDYVKALKNHELPSQSDEQLQNQLLLSVMNIMTPMLSTQLLTQIENLNVWDDKLDCLITLTENDNLKLSPQMKKAIFTSILQRLRAIEEYNISTLPPIKSSIILIKPTQPALRSMPEDYGLKNITEGKVEIYYAEGNHETLLESDKIVLAINGEIIENS